MEPLNLIWRLWIRPSQLKLFDFDGFYEGKDFGSSNQIFVSDKNFFVENFCVGLGSAHLNGWIIRVKLDYRASDTLKIHLYA